MERQAYEPPAIVSERELAFGRLSETIDREPEFDFVRELAEEFPAAKAYLVGGSVRDIVLERPSKDYDFVVTGVAPAELEKFLAKRGSVDLVGKSFGVYKFRPKDSRLPEEIDVALPRKDIAAGTGGYRDVETQSDKDMSVENDLSRRDFTFNAMAWDVRARQLVDPHGGLFDLLGKKVKAVGEPRQRFSEDYSRMLRGLRQAAAFGFGFDEATWQALREEMPHINDERTGADGKPERVVPYEVIARELLKGLKADPVRTMDLWDESGAFAELMPEMLRLKGCRQTPDVHSEGDVWAHTRLALLRLSSPEFAEMFGDEKADVGVALAVMLHDIGKPDTRQEVVEEGRAGETFFEHEAVGARIAAEIAERLKLSSAKGLDVTKEHLAWLVGGHLFPSLTDPSDVRASTVRKWFFDPRHRGTDLLMLAFADADATVAPDGKTDTANVRGFVRMVREFGEKFAKEGRVKPLLTGGQVMKALGIKPGPAVGEALDALLDAQGRGEVTDEASAVEFLKKLKK